MQRKAAYNFNLAAQMFSDPKYGDQVPDKIKFYSYDAYANAFPKGISYQTAPPEDIYGVKTFSEE